MKEAITKPNPPKYDITQLNDQSQFLCKRGEKLTVPRLDINNQPKNPPLESYYCTDDTNVPIEVLNTGNVEVLSSYLTDHANELNDKERQHLTERIDVMQHFADLEKRYRDNPRTSVGEMVEQDGKKVLPSIVLDRKQDTGNGCWSCAFSMLLKGRGVDVDQKLIRRYRPEFVRGHEIISPEQKDPIETAKRNVEQAPREAHDMSIRAAKTMMQKGRLTPEQEKWTAENPELAQDAMLAVKAVYAESYDRKPHDDLYYQQMHNADKHLTNLAKQLETKAAQNTREQPTARGQMV